MVAANPSDGLAAAIVDIVLDDASAVADESAARAGNSGSVPGETDVRQGVIARLRGKIFEAKLSGVVGAEAFAVAGTGEIGLEEAEACVADKGRAEYVGVANSEVLGVIGTDDTKADDVGDVGEVVIRVGVAAEEVAFGGDAVIDAAGDLVAALPVAGG